MAKRAASASAGAPSVLHQTLEIPPATKPEPEEIELEALSFWEEVAAVPENLWWNGIPVNQPGGTKGYRVYIYDDDVKGSPYLAVITHPFDIEWVKQEFGGGSYRVQLNDSDHGRVALERFSIAGESKRKQPPTSVQNAPAAAIPSHDTVLIQFLDAMREEQRQTREMLREALSRGAAPGVAVPQQIDPTEQFKGMIQLFTTMIPKQSDPLELLIKLQTLAPKQADPLETLLKFKQAGLLGEGEGNLMEKLTMVMTVAEKMGLQAGGGRSWAEILIEKGPEIAREIRNIVGDYKAVEQTRAETANRVLKIQENAKQYQSGAQPPSAASSPHIQPQPKAGPQAVVPQPGINPGAPTLDVEPIGTPGQQIAENMAAQVDLIKRKIVQMIWNGFHGDQIVAWLDVEAPILLEGFEKRTEETLLRECAADPILSQAAGAPRMRECVREIVEALNDVEPEESGSEHGPN